MPSNYIKSSNRLNVHEEGLVNADWSDRKPRKRVRPLPVNNNRRKSIKVPNFSIKSTKRVAESTDSDSDDDEY